MLREVVKSQGRVSPPAAQEKYGNGLPASQGTENAAGRPYLGQRSGSGSPRLDSGAGFVGGPVPNLDNMGFWRLRSKEPSATDVEPAKPRVQHRASAASSIPLDRLYDLNLAVGDMLEHAQSIARIKERTDRKPDGRNLSVINASPIHLMETINGGYRLRAVERRPDTTAEVVVYSEPEKGVEPESAVTEFQQWMQYVNGDGGIFVGQYSKRNANAIRADYPDTGSMDLTPSGEKTIITLIKPQMQGISSP